jgi:hypothetical protein
VSAALINVKPHIWTNRVFSAFLFWRWIKCWPTESVT